MSRRSLYSAPSSAHVGKSPSRATVFAALPPLPVWALRWLGASEVQIDMCLHGPEQASLPLHQCMHPHEGP